MIKVFKRLGLILILTVLCGSIGYLSGKIYANVNKPIAIAPTATPTPTPTETPTIENDSVDSPPAQSGVTIGQDELISAINAFRLANGASVLSVSEELCNEARKRIQDMITLNNGNGGATLSHDGFNDDAANVRLRGGKDTYGENIAYANCRRTNDNVIVNITSGTQLVEWCFASSVGHRENMLRSDWRNVCSLGSYPYYVQIFSN